MSERDESARLERLFEAALGAPPVRGSAGALREVERGLAQDGRDGALAELASEEPEARACHGCGAELPLKRVTCPGCYRREFRPVLTKGQKALAHRMAMIGLAGCGKTVYVTQLFWYLWNDVSLNPAFPWEVSLETAPTRRFVETNRARITQGAWPVKTVDFAEQAIHATVKEKRAGRTYQLLISDVSGETVQRFFSQNDRAVDSPAEAKYLAHVFNSQSILLLIDANRLTARDAWDIEGFLTMYEREHGITDEPKEVWLALVITKSDELEAAPGSPEEVARECLRGTFTRLQECFRYVRVFLVSAAGKTVEQAGGAVGPDPFALPVGIHEPLAWILDGIQGYDAERRATRQEQRREDDEASIDEAWSDHFARRRRARWRLLATVVIGALVLGLFAATAWTLTR